MNTARLFYLQFQILYLLQILQMDLSAWKVLKKLWANSQLQWATQKEYQSLKPELETKSHKTLYMHLK